MVVFDVANYWFYPSSGSETLPHFLSLVLLAFLGDLPGQIICVPLICYDPGNPGQQFLILVYTGNSFYLCNCGESVSPSKGFPAKLITPIIIPELRVFAIDTLLPNSYFLCSLPLAIQLTWAGGGCKSCSLNLFW